MVGERRQVDLDIRVQRGVSPHLTYYRMQRANRVYNYRKRALYG